MQPLATFIRRGAMHFKKSSVADTNLMWPYRLVWLVALLAGYFSAYAQPDLGRSAPLAIGLLVGHGRNHCHLVAPEPIGTRPLDIAFPRLKPRAKATVLAI